MNQVSAIIGYAALVFNSLVCTVVAGDRSIAREDSMSYTKLVLLALLTCGFASAASANSSTVTLRDRENAACYDDVQRLCGDFVPDEDAIKTCMVKKRSQVSPVCAKFYKQGAAK
jgi:hypothetical protein